MLSSVDYRACYTTGEAESPISFFTKALSNSKSFDLGLGFFSSASFNVLSLGFAKFISNGGKMRLYINQFLSEDDYKLITTTGIDIEDRIINDFNSMLGVLSKRDQHFFNCLSYLISQNRIEIKVIIPKNGGIAHQKLGVFSDGYGNRIAFNGSLNMTASALLSKNIETVSCFYSWKGADESIDEYQRIFDQYFNNKRDDIIVIEAKKLSHEIIKAFPSQDEKKILDDEEQLLQDYKKKDIAPVEIKAANPDSPCFPYSSGAFQYQIDAYNRWVQNGHKGIFAMATGTGKTITSLNCALEEYKKNNKYHLLILVPSNDLVAQWTKEVANFSFKNIYIVNGKVDWRKQITELVNDFEWDIQSNYVIISTYASFTDTLFQKKVKELAAHDPDMTLIADEAHNVGSNQVSKAFESLTIKKRIALSATPNRAHDPEGTAAVERFFNDRPPYCYSFSMKQAIDAGRLTHYLYYPKVTYLDSEEMEKYVKLTRAMLRFFDPNTKSFKDSVELQNLLMARKRIIHKAQGKYGVFREILEELIQKGKAKYCFVYTPEGIDYESDKEERIIDKMRGIVTENHPEISVNTFLGGDDEKQDKLRAFAEGKIDMLFAMKCLDEGVDVPRAEVGIFTSSTGNPRQFIQRRGRLLRTHSSKNFAYIYDAIVIPNFKLHQDKNTFEMERSLVRGEIMRVAYFASLADNYYSATESLREVLDYYGLEVSTLISELQEQ